MKTEKEIREAIESCKRTINNYRNAYNNNLIYEKVYLSKEKECETMIEAFKWVIGDFY